MRDQRQHKGRDCIYPEVPRDYHTGIKGTFMDDFHHNHYFKVGASRFLSSPPPFSNPAPLRLPRISDITNSSSLGAATSTLQFSTRRTTRG